MIIAFAIWGTLCAVAGILVISQVDHIAQEIWVGIVFLNATISLGVAALLKGIEMVLEQLHDMTRAVRGEPEEEKERRVR